MWHITVVGVQSTSSLESLSLRSMSETTQHLGEVHLLVSSREPNSPYKVVRHIRSKEWDTLIHFPRGDFELMKQYDKKSKEMRFVLVLRPNAY